MLFATVGLRRLKRDVMAQLPAKRRTCLLLPTSPAADGRGLARLRQMMASGGVDGGGGSSGGGGGGGEGGGRGAERRALLVQNFHVAAVAKLPAVQAQVHEALRVHRKVVFFAHHQVLLDGVQRGALAAIPHVRIDGSTAAAARHEAVARFQADAGVRAALIGITVGGTALTLTAASVVVFLELYWTPGALLQAEDRVHRIGQTARLVEVEYWLGEGTIDDLLWPLLQRKARVVGHALGGNGSLASATGLAVDDIRPAGAATVAATGGAAAAARGAAAATAVGAAAARGVVASRFFGAGSAGSAGAVGAELLTADNRHGESAVAAAADDAADDFVDDSVP